MAESAIRQQALRLIDEGGKVSFGGAHIVKQAPMIAAAILDLADAVRELARATK